MDFFLENIPIESVVKIQAAKIGHRDFGTHMCNHLS